MSGILETIHPDGTVDTAVWSGSGRPTLEVLQAAVGGYIEMVWVNWEGRECEAYIDEDGLSKKLAPNPFAGEATVNGHQVVGPMVVWMPSKAIRK